MKVGFIGCGNMGSALVHAVKNTVSPWRIAVYEKDESKALSFSARTGVIVTDMEEIAVGCSYIFLAVKPQALPSLSQELKPLLENRKTPFTLISMAAGVKIERIKELFGEYPIIRIMPNLPVSVGAGMIMWTASEDVSEGSCREFLEMMHGAGEFVNLNESLFDAGTSVSGCGPAFVCMFIDALKKGGVACGLSEGDALKLAEQTLYGTAKMLIETLGNPDTLKVNVCSPGGSTIEGVRSLEKDDIYTSVGNAVKASYKRNVELGK